MRFTPEAPPANPTAMRIKVLGFWQPTSRQILYKGMQIQRRSFYCIEDEL
jgi:hypothetical protein